MTIKAVFFDIGGTLLTTTSVLKNRMNKINRKHIEALGGKFTEEEVEEARKKADDFILKKYGNPHKKDVIFPKVMFKFLGIKLDDDEARKIDEDFWHEIYSSIGLIKNAAETLGYLKRKGYKLVVVTNNRKDRARKILDKFGLLKFFDGVVTSEEFGLKSTMMPFKIAMGRFGLRPDEVLMVGNHLFEDVLPAKTLGMRTVIVDFKGNLDDVPKSDVMADYVIKDLIDIKEILEEIDRKVV
jgi:HAD superfamily hydrolase (TIGR01549 family)